MTRAVHDSNSRSLKYSSSVHLRSVSGGVAKSYRPSSPGRSLKAYAKPQSKAQCLQILKSLLPNAKEQEHASELELVRETIAYISHLESILSPSQQPAAAAAEQQTQPSALVTATAMLEEMTV